MTSPGRPRLPLYFAVGLAASLGGVIRYSVSLASLQASAESWPWPTLVVNLLGSFLIAAYWRVAGPESRLAASPERRTAVMTGFCGGLTTFSVFGVETLLLIDQSRWVGAIAYVLLTGAGALGAAWLGLACFRQGNRPT